MAAYASLSDYVAQLAKPTQRFSWIWNTLAATIGKKMSLWKVGPNAGAAPLAPANPDNTTAGGILHVNGGSGQLWLPRMSVMNNSAGTLMIADRLFHCGGLLGTLTGAQAVMGNSGSGSPSITIANPAVVTLASHGFGIGQEVKFTTTGALPSHIVSGTSYWVSVTGWTTGAFSISTTRANALAGTNVSTVGDTQSGVHTVTGQVPITLPRYTDGKGVRAAIEISTTVGVTARTVSGVYTDAEANSSKTSTAVPIGASGDREAGRLIELGLAAQDSSSSASSGFKAVSDITLSASTSTAGDLAVILYKPLLYLPMYGLEDPSMYDALFVNGGNLQEILDNACLMAIVTPNLSGTGVIGVSPVFTET
jgi:hypothetical protein